MARIKTRLRSSRRTLRLDFAALEIVGALLTPDIVARIAAFEAIDQDENSYGVPPGLKLRDEIARYFRVGEALWHNFAAVKNQSPVASERFVRDLLRQCFGFDQLHPQQTVHKGEREFPIRYGALNGRVPIVIAPAAQEGARKSGVDESLSQFGDGNRRRSATLLLQEYLNAQEEALWGLCTDGQTLRLLRDNVSLTRPAWIEADLAKIFEEGLFPDFSALWLLIHQSRFGSPEAAPADCALERWRDTGRIEGVAAREKLRDGVESALVELGQGFIEHAANNQLRQALREGTLSRQGYFEELLRLIYRLIFLFAAEDRDLLHTPGVPRQAKDVYAQGYSIGRLRERCIRRTAWDKNTDVFEGLKATFRALGKGEPSLGLPALGGLFAPGQMPHLNASATENRRMLAAIWRLAWMRPEGQPLTRVNWRDMETEELGSVYESLLELIPLPSAEARTFEFAEADQEKGNKRKETGSYYTPDALVQLLLSETLEPILDAAEARSPDNPVTEILKLSVIDPACGSGHFLLGAARRIAARIVRHRSPGAPSQEEYQHALREVVAHCIFGVDRNAMAVDLCKVALWIEALEPGKPLTFLDNHIRCGDSLLGIFDYEILRAGLPDEAFDPLTGDDKDIAKAYRDINKEQRDGKASAGLIRELSAPVAISDGAEKILAMPEDTLAQVHAKAQAFDRLISDENWWALKTACDLYVAAFLMPKTGDVPDPRATERLSVPTTEAIWRAVGGGDIRYDMPETCIVLAAQNRVFHWPLEFPAIIARGGFDVVIGNPPWERIKLQEQEFFAARDPEIARAPNKSERKKLINALKHAEIGSSKARLSDEFDFAKRIAEAVSVFVRKSGRYPWTGTGDVNTYALFAEHFLDLARWKVDHEIQGRSGVIVPTGIATDSSTSAFFGNLVKSNRLSALYDFENREKIFPAVDSRVKFSILSIGKSDRAKFGSYLLRPDDLADEERQIALREDDFRLFNPNTLTAPLFRARADWQLTKKLYAAAPVLIRERPDHPDGDDNPWGITFQTLFHMSNDSGLFRDAGQLTTQGFERNGANWRHEDGSCYVPLFEAKMVHHYDHRFGSYAGLNARPSDASLPETPESLKADPNYEVEPWYWVPEDETALRVARVPSRLKQYYRKGKADGCLKVLAEWVVGTLDPEDLSRERLAHSVALASARLKDVLGPRALERDITGAKLATWLGKVADNARAMQRETPLSEDDLALIRQGPTNPLELTAALIERKQPRWLMGWRDICRSTDERTLISTLFPKSGVNHKVPLLFANQSAPLVSALLGCISSVPLDYAVRQKIGGTSMTYFYFKQFPIFQPEAYSSADIEYISWRVLELTYTSYFMTGWAEDLGYSGGPFEFNLERRAKLRAELDAFFAVKYGLTRDELRYILDPADVRGADYPSETFRGLKRNEIDRFDEYRTQRLVLEAFDRLTGRSGAVREAS